MSKNRAVSLAESDEPVWAGLLQKEESRVRASYPEITGTKAHMENRAVA